MDGCFLLNRDAATPAPIELIGVRTDNPDWLERAWKTFCVVFGP